MFGFLEKIFTRLITSIVNVSNNAKYVSLRNQKVRMQSENISKENMSLEFRFENIDEPRNYFIVEIDQNDWISKLHKKVCATRNYIEILASAVTLCLSISTFASLLGVLIGITNYAIGLKICAITVVIKRYKSIIKTNKKKHDKIVLLAETKLNNIDVLTSKSLIDSNIYHNDFVLIDRALKE